MSQDQKPFAVNDRRHFTPDGRPREEPTEEGDTARRPPRPPDPLPRAAPEADFGTFLLSLGAQASLLLSGESAPEEDAGAALQQARSMIAILEVLKEKTEGRRTPREDGILDGILYELRMGYLAKARVDGA